MDDGLRRYTAEEIQAALGDKPFIVQGLWPADPGAADPAPALAPPERGPSAGVPASKRPVSPAPDWAFEAAEFRRTRPRKWPAPRRWPVVALLGGTALAAGCMAISLLPPSPPQRAAPGLASGPLVLTADAPTPSPASPALTPAFHSTPVAAAAWRNTTEAPLPAEPPVPALATAQVAAAQPVVAPPATAQPVAAYPPDAPNTPRPSDPLLAAALMQRAEGALARSDIAAARAFYVRAASVDPWSAEALVGVGKTYDPDFLYPRGVTGGLADPGQARRWYDRASQLGDSTAATLAGRLGGGR